MGLFPFFPKIERFCFCTRNLKCAAITIIIIGMISSIHRVAIISKPQCKSLYKYNSPILIPLYIFLYLFFLFEILLLSNGFVLLLSIFFKPNSLAADTYICCAIITAIVSIVFAVIQLLQGTINDCGFQGEVLNFIVYFVMWIYFVFVINTYRDDMSED